MGVSDGDTVTLLDDAKGQHKIRLRGIDAHEKNQAFGKRPKESLIDLVFAKTLDVETDKADRYERRVGKIWVNGIVAKLEQIKRGMALHFKRYKRYKREPSIKGLREHAEAALLAREVKRGLWKDVEPLAPWDFRRK